MAASNKWVGVAKPDSLMGEVARLALEVRLARVQHFLPLAAYLSEEDVEYVHSARVATRRAAAALEMFRTLLPKKRRRGMKQTLREVRNSMGEARDLDVYLQRFAGSDEPGVDLLLRQLTRQRRKAQRPIVDCVTPLMTGERLRNRCRKVVKLAGRYASKGLRRERFDAWASVQLKRAWVRFAKTVPCKKPSAKQLHKFRIATKRFRYTLELLSGGLPPAIREQAYPQVKHLQEQLGEIQDHTVAAARLEKWQSSTDNEEQRELLARYRHVELELYHGKSEAFQQWWRSDRIDELRAVIEGDVALVF